MFLFYIFVFLFGLIIGSFLNVVIYRLETGEKISTGRSHCMKCKRTLRWYELFPVASFLALRGKCRRCKKPISIQYPLVEIATGILFVAILNIKLGVLNQIPFFGFMFFISAAYYLYIASALIVIFAYDFKHYIIPDEVVYSAIGAAFLYKLFVILDYGKWNLSGFWNTDIGSLLTTYNPFIAAILAGGFFLAIVLFTRGEGMGGGDIKLAFLMGLVLGTDKIISSLAIAFTLGAIIGIILIILKKKTLKSAIPFGPFLVIGTIIGLLI